MCKLARTGPRKNTREIGTSIEQAITRMTAPERRLAGSSGLWSATSLISKIRRGTEIYLWEVSQAVPESELVHSAGKVFGRGGLIHRR